MYFSTNIHRYVVLELVDPSDKRLKDTKKKKTKVVKKNLQPAWNEELVWDEVTQDLADAFLKVSFLLILILFFFWGGERLIVHYSSEMT